MPETSKKPDTILITPKGSNVKSLIISETELNANEPATVAKLAAWLKTIISEDPA